MTKTPDLVPSVTDEDWLITDAVTPATGGTLAPLYAAAAAGRVDMPFCGACDQVLELEQDVCDRCGSPSVAWRPVEPSGTVHSVTTVHRSELGLTQPFSGPYHVVDAELASGHRIVLTTARPEEKPPALGDPIRIAFRRLGGHAIPAVEPSSADHTDDPEIRR